MGATTAQWGDNNSAIRGNNMAMGQQQHNQGKWREMGGQRQKRNQGRQQQSNERQYQDKWATTTV
jgi:hypothetical protein